MSETVSKNTFIIAAACFHWLAQNHSGQGSPEYRLLSKLRQVYQPGFGQQMFEQLDESTRVIFDMIESVDQCKVLLAEEGLLR